ncbi:MAG: BpuSI family type II restriction endonuclease [Methyloprofundus sp.]|nr:BpuSI family type II restriction endonuclease [Methyloprofundus sp.]
MTRPVLPYYSSSETKDFHPVFKQALEELLNKKKLLGDIKIVGEFPTPTGPVDFALIDISTNKVILPIEIKRTQSSLRGGGRRQARDYWSNLGAQCQTNFYCASNLEMTELFRYDRARPTTLSQLIELQHAKAGVLGSTDTNTFYTNLIDCLEEVLEITLGNTPYNYAKGLTQFQNNIQAAVDNKDKWHQIFITAAFEYIRGASSNESNLKSLTASWKSVDFYKSNPSRINQLGSGVDFEHIFCDPLPLTSDPDAFLSSILLEAYESGKLLGRGDDVAELVNSILAPKGLGIVETDAELAQLMAIMAKASLGRELLVDEIVIDPASGSGRLLTALPITAFPSINPTQVWANEIQHQFAEPLSLRLGLAFASVINPSNSPKISISGIEEVDKNEFDKVKLVVMNPPFLSGIQSSNIKDKFIDRIKTLSGSCSKLNEGQIALEALFLELVTNLVSTGTVMVTVFPLQHLYRLSSEVVKLRKFLISEFGLSHIVLYPSKGIFESVTKQTVILVGEKGNKNSEIFLVEVQKKVSDIDFSQLLIGLTSKSTTPAHGVELSKISQKKLLGLAEDGWKGLIGAGLRVQSFMDRYFKSFQRLSQLPGKQVRRGVVGNNGNTSLTVFDGVKPRYPDIVKLIPKSWLRPVLNTTETMPRILNSSSAPEASFIPPESAYIPGNVDNQTLNSIVDVYLKVHKRSSGSQAKKIKTKNEVIANIKSNQKNLGPGWVLIQRASRTKGQISILEEDGILLSTNVPMVKLPSYEERMLLGSWLLSIFGQIQFELFSTPQEGMRKLEMNGIKQILYPDFSKIPSTLKTSLIKNLITESAVSFGNVNARPSDQLWASFLAPYAQTDCLNEAVNLLQEIIDERKGFGNKS